MNSDSEYAHGETGERTLAAVFGHRDSAHIAVKRLHDEGFRKTWIGVTREDETVAADDTSAGAKVGRFFRGERDGSGLAETLMKHGVSADDAASIEASVRPNDVLLVFDGGNHPELAARIVESCGGAVQPGQSFIAATIAWSTGDDSDTREARLREERTRDNTVPTLYEEIFVVGFDDGDEIDTSPENTGRRSAGGAIGTQHREDLPPAP